MVFLSRFLTISLVTLIHLYIFKEECNSFSIPQPNYPQQFSFYNQNKYHPIIFNQIKDRRPRNKWKNYGLRSLICNI
jgi:hypothetical protein